MPYFIEHADRCRVALALAQRREAGTKARRRGVRDGGGAGQRAEALDVGGDRLRCMRVAAVDRDAQRAQLLDLRRGDIRPGDGKIGLQADDLFEIERARIADARQVSRLRRPVGRIAGRDDTIARAGCEQELGRAAARG